MNCILARLFVLASLDFNETQFEALVDYGMFKVLLEQSMPEHLLPSEILAKKNRIANLCHCQKHVDLCVLQPFAKMLGPPSLLQTTIRLVTKCTCTSLAA